MKDNETNTNLAMVTFVRLEDLERKAEQLENLLKATKAYIDTHKGTSTWFHNSARRYEYEVAALNLYSVVDSIEKPNGN